MWIFNLFPEHRFLHTTQRNLKACLRPGDIRKNAQTMMDGHPDDCAAFSNKPWAAPRKAPKRAAPCCPYHFKRGIINMNDCGISKLDLKRRNRMQVLKVVRENGPISRVDISSLLGITRAAVTIITNEMIDQNILEEVGEEPVNPAAEVRKGRRKILLDINETYKFAVGIYIDEKEISVGLTTLSAAALDKRSFPHQGDMTPEKLGDLLEVTLKKMLQNSCLSYKNLLGVGVGVMPSAYAMMGVTPGSENDPVFPELQSILEARTRLHVYINSAAREFAMAGICYNEIHTKAESQVFLYWDNGCYHAIPVRECSILLPSTGSDAFVEHLCVDPAGKELEGYPRGSVRAELSAAGAAEKLRPLFSAENTPALYQALEGDLERLTPAALLTAAETDTALADVTEQILWQFCLMLQALHCLYFAEHVTLYGFGFTQEHLERIRKTAAALAGEEFAQAIVLSPIPDRSRFLCGCTYLIQTGFYQRGGLV